MLHSKLAHISRQVKVCTHNLPCKLHHPFISNRLPHVPFTKLNSTIETQLGIRTPLVTAEDQRSTGTPKSRTPVLLKAVFSPTVIQRVLVTSLSILVSILVPEFSSMMAFLGSFSAFILCVIGPITAKIMLAGRCGIFDGVILALSIMKATWGTAVAFLAA